MMVAMVVTVVVVAVMLVVTVVLARRVGLSPPRFRHEESKRKRRLTKMSSLTRTPSLVTQE